MQANSNSYLTINRKKVQSNVHLLAFSEILGNYLLYYLNLSLFLLNYKRRILYFTLDKLEVYKEFHPFVFNCQKEKLTNQELNFLLIIKNLYTKEISVQLPSATYQQS